MPVTLTDADVAELRRLLHGLHSNPFEQGEVMAMGGLRSVLSRELLAKLCVQVPPNQMGETLYSMRETARAAAVARADLPPSKFFHPEDGHQPDECPTGACQTDTCAQECYLAADVIATTFAPNEPPRVIVCELRHPHKDPHLAEGWSWQDGRIWRVNGIEEP